MDSDPYSDNIFVETSIIKPFILFKNEDFIKVFNTIFLNDESETIVFSEANFTEDYKFLKGSIKALSLRTSEYMAIKTVIKNGLDIEKLRYYKPGFAIETNLLVTDDKALLVQEGMEIPYSASMII